MANEVATQKAANGLSFAVPAHLQSAMAQAGHGNIVEKASVPSLTYGGKVWTISTGGEKKVLQRKNEDGEMENVQILRVVVLDYAKQRGRALYEGAYDDANPRQPECWSEDGKKPHVAVEAPQCSSCEVCPKAAKGSKVVDGREMIACAQHRMLAVVPAANLDFEPLRLKIAVTSDWDKSDEESMANGWYGFSNYVDFLRANGCAWSNALVTRMRFANTKYPKVQFARGDFLDADDFQKTLAIGQGEGVKKLLSAWTPAGADGKPATKGKALPVDDETPAADPVFSKTGADAQAAQAEEAAKAKARAVIIAAGEAAKQKAQEAAQEAEAQAEAAKVAKKAAKVAAAKAAAEAAAAAAAAAIKAAEEDEDDGASGFDEPAAPPTAPVKAPAALDAAPPKKAAKKEPPAAPASAPAEVPPALTGILGEWE
jgi:hypothetical protein